MFSSLVGLAGPVGLVRRTLHFYCICAFSYSNSIVHTTLGEHPFVFSLRLWIMGHGLYTIRISPAPAIYDLFPLKLSTFPIRFLDIIQHIFVINTWKLCIQGINLKHKLNKTLSDFHCRISRGMIKEYIDVVSTFAPAKRKAFATI